jgi:hypothetical protein
MTYEPPQPPPPQPAPQMYGAPPAYPPPAPAANGASVAALICGIVSLLIGWIPLVGVIGVITGIAAVITGVIGMQHPNGRAMAIIGLVCGALVIVLWLIGLALIIAATVTQFAAATNMTNS